MNIVKLTQSITVQNVMWQHFQRRNKHGVINQASLLPADESVATQLLCPLSLYGQDL